MYIPPFWFGAIATMLVELLVSIIMAYVRTKSEKGEKDDDCN